MLTSLLAVLALHLLKVNGLEDENKVHNFAINSTTSGPYNLSAQVLATFRMMSNLTRNFKILDLNVTSFKTGIFTNQSGSNKLTIKIPNRDYTETLKMVMESYDEKNRITDKATWKVLKQYAEDAMKDAIGDDIKKITFEKDFSHQNQTRIEIKLSYPTRCMYESIPSNLTKFSDEKLTRLVSQLVLIKHPWLPGLVAASTMFPESPDGPSAMMNVRSSNKTLIAELKELEQEIEQVYNLQQQVYNVLDPLRALDCISKAFKSKFEALKDNYRKLISEQLDRVTVNVMFGTHE